MWTLLIHWLCLVNLHLNDWRFFILSLSLSSVIPMKLTMYLLWLPVSIEIIVLHLFLIYIYYIFILKQLQVRDILKNSLVRKTNQNISHFLNVYLSIIHQRAVMIKCLQLNCLETRALSTEMGISKHTWSLPEEEEITVLDAAALVLEYNKCVCMYILVWLSFLVFNYVITGFQL